MIVLGILFFSLVFIAALIVTARLFRRDRVGIDPMVATWGDMPEVTAEQVRLLCARRAIAGRAD